jgi:hypothetical protein
MEKDVPAIINAIENYFARQVSLLRSLCDLSRTNKRENKLFEFYPLMLSVVTAGESITLLLKADKVGESFIISRAFIERAANLCYLLVCDNEERTNFVDYSLQKAFRTARSRHRANLMLGLDSKLPEPNEWMSEKLKKFTSSKGKEITRWTRLNMVERLKYVQKEIKDTFSDSDIAILRNIYEDSSESVHGTLYGTIHHTGLFTTKCAFKALSFMHFYIAMMQFNCGAMVGQIFKIISLKTDMAMNEIQEQSEQNYKTISKYFATD